MKSYCFNLWKRYISIFLAFNCSFALADPLLGYDFFEFEGESLAVSNKVKVIEFFSYECAGCYHFGPDVGSWYSSQPANVALELVPVVKDNPSVFWARLFFTLQEMNRLSDLHYEVYAAIHDRAVDLFSQAERSNWLTSLDVDIDRFNHIFNSDDVANRIFFARTMTSKYAITVTPTLVVGGVFWTTASLIRERKRLAPVLDFMVDKARREALSTD